MLIIPKPAYANPTVYQSSPTAYTTSGGLKSYVTNPTNAYDSNNATYATFQYGVVSSGEFEVKSFSTSGAPTTTEQIAFVDFKIKYTAAAAATDDEYKIVYWVKPSAIPTVLVQWTSSAHSVPADGCDVWTSQREPNDDVWSWTDVSNIRVVVETDDGLNDLNDGAAFELYEVWVTVYSYPQPTLYVDPSTTVKGVAETFTVDINVTEINELYAWEFKLVYNGTLLNVNNVTEGTFLNVSGAKPSYFNVLNMSDTALPGPEPRGQVWATCTLLGDVQGTYGGGVLATIGFTVATSGSCTLDLKDTKLTGYAYNVYSRRLYDITHTADDGTFNTAPEIPEFPLGAAMEIALATVIVYIWFKRKGKNKHMQITS